MMIRETKGSTPWQGNEKVIKKKTQTKRKTPRYSCACSKDK